MNTFQIKKKLFSVDFVGYVLITFSSLLIGIWAVKNTIALRNALLVLGALVSIFYIPHQLKLLFRVSKASIWRFMPLALMFLMFIWVLLHYFFLSKYPELQLGELKSTWARSLMAAVLGLATGMALQRKPKALNLFWLGAILSFVILFVQYIPRAYSLGSLYAMDLSGGYIYIGKINAVLIGTILIAGLGGMVLDQVLGLRIQKSRISSSLFVFGVILVLFSYVFIFDTRNGIGLAALIFLGWILYGCVVLIKNRSWRLADHARSILIALIAITVVMAFAYQQARHNSGWNTLIEDTKIAVQIEKYPNWQNPEKMGYPKTAEGREVARNTYERVAWAVAGVRLIPTHILGVGVLMHPFGKALKDHYSDALPVSTHSAWVEFTLAFGVPGFILMFGTLLSIMAVGAFSSHVNFRVTIFSLSISLMMLYGLGELNTHHGVEVLFFFMATLIGLGLQIGRIEPKN